MEQGISSSRVLFILFTDTSFPGEMAKMDPTIAMALIVQGNLSACTVASDACTVPMACHAHSYATLGCCYYLKLLLGFYSVMGRGAPPPPPPPPPPSKILTSLAFNDIFFSQKHKYFSLGQLCYYNHLAMHYIECYTYFVKNAFTGLCAPFAKSLNSTHISLPH